MYNARTHRDLLRDWMVIQLINHLTTIISTTFSKIAWLNLWRPTTLPSFLQYDGVVSLEDEVRIELGNRSDVVVHIQSWSGLSSVDFMLLNLKTLIYVRSDESSDGEFLSQFDLEHLHIDLRAKALSLLWFWRSVFSQHTGSWSDWCFANLNH